MHYKYFIHGKTVDRSSRLIKAFYHDQNSRSSNVYENIEVVIICNLEERNLFALQIKSEHRGNWRGPCRIIHLAIAPVTCKVRDPKTLNNKFQISIKIFDWFTSFCGIHMSR